MSREKSIVVTTIDIEAMPELTMEELCEACSVSPEYIEEIIGYGVIEPMGTLDQMRFTEIDLRRVRTILHLQNDLEINVAGAALVVDLMEEIEDMRARMEILEKYFGQA